MRVFWFGFNLHAQTFSIYAAAQLVHLAEQTFRYIDIY